MATAQSALKRRDIGINTGARPLLPRIYKYRERYLLLLPAVALLFLFRYIPMAGLVLAWKDFKVLDGIFGSPWAGWKYFERLFSGPQFGRVLGNTLTISALRIFIGFPMPIIFALILNEIFSLRYKKIVQTISYLPHFLSWVVVAGLVRAISGSSGPVNQLISWLGLSSSPILFLQNQGWFLTLLIGSGIWQSVGWGSIIYLAAITAIDPALYESAQIDGASRLQRIRHITIPSITYIIVILFLLRIGHVLEAGFDQILNLYNPLVYGVADIIDTYVYRIGIQGFQYSFATAVGLFKNVVGVAAMLTVVQVTRRLGQESTFTLS